jgi:predicted DNA-binding transcriptional regulator AlpA
MMLTPERLAAYRARLPDGDMMLTVNEVCQWLAIVPSSLYRFLKREEYRFPRPYSLDPVATKMVSTARFRKSEIEAWLKTLPRRIGTARIPNAPGST